VFDQALTLLTAHFTPRTNVPYERQVFRTIVPNLTEPIDSYFARLRQQADLCQFGDTLDENLRDQFIAACPWPELKRDLMKEAKLGPLIFTRTVDLTQMFQQLENEVGAAAPTFSQFSADARETLVNRIRPQPQSLQNQHTNQLRRESRSYQPDRGRRPQSNVDQRCYRSGRSGHIKTDSFCPA